MIDIIFSVFSYVVTLAYLLPSITYTCKCDLNYIVFEFILIRKISQIL